MRPVATHRFWAAEAGDTPSGGLLGQLCGTETL